MRIALCRVPALLVFLFEPTYLAAQEVLYRSGDIMVKRTNARFEDAAGNRVMVPVHNLIHGYFLYGSSFADERFQRLATTYYHPRGPLGMVMQRLNWFQDDVNKFRSDSRLPSSLVGMGNGTFDTTMGQLAVMWSEPPIAVIGMHAGTIAAYARYGQHFHFFEPSKEIIKLSEPGKHRYFPFVMDARARGAKVQIFHGPPRRELASKAPRSFYQVMVLEACFEGNAGKISPDMMTREGIAECISHLTDDGILCVHVSNRFLDLPRVLAAIADDLKLAYRLGYDRGEHSLDRSVRNQRSSSQWFMLARRAEILDKYCATPDGYVAPKSIQGREHYWSVEPPPNKRHLWTDKDLVHLSSIRHTL